MHCGLKLSPQRVAEKYQDRPFGPFRPLSETILHMVVITISVNAPEYDEYCLTIEVGELVSAALYQYFYPKTVVVSCGLGCQISQYQKRAGHLCYSFGQSMAWT